MTPSRPLLLLALLVTGYSAHSQTANDRPVQLQNVKITQQVNKQIPLDLAFQDSSGGTVTMRQLLKGKPLILAFAYYNCPRLCSMVLIGLLKSLRTMNFTAGHEFNVVTLSFDPRETPELAAAKKRTYVESYGRPGAEDGWHFLTGSKRNIELITNAAGYGFEYDPKTDQYSHAAAILLLTPDGRISRYYFGIEFSPRDLRLGIVEAAQGKIGNAVDQILLYCFHYDPETGRYSLAILNVIRSLAVLAVLAMGSLIIVSVRRDSNRRPAGFERQDIAS